MARLLPNFSPKERSDHLQNCKRRSATGQATCFHSFLVGRWGEQELNRVVLANDVRVYVDDDISAVAPNLKVIAFPVSSRRRKCEDVGIRTSYLERLSQSRLLLIW
jgi:hypothetical protein